MLQVATYDDLIELTYRASEGDAHPMAILKSLQAMFAAQSAGFLVYDEDGHEVAYAIYASFDQLSASDSAELARAGKDPAARLFYRLRHEQPRRLTDLVPESRLAVTKWYLLQVALAKIRYGIIMDFDVADVRVRFYLMRAVDQSDFSTDELMLVGRVCRHIKRAFRRAPSLLAPDHLVDTAQVAVFKPNEMAKRVRHAGAMEHLLSTRFQLTDAEARVASTFVDAKSRREAAEVLGISMNTLGTHLRRIYAKMGVRRASELALALHGARF